MLKEKIETQKQWNSNPCGQIGEITMDLKYFLDVESHRYNEYGPWMKSFYNYQSHNGVKLLEVGFGQGTDLVQYAKGGADCYGVDITERHYELARINFKLRNLSANLFLQDASKLPFDNNYFDKVVSFGVLHHTPDIENCVKEVLRVLKPGGSFVLSLYYKNSIFYWWNKVFCQGILQGKLFSLGYEGLLATIETGADGKEIKPYVKVYSKKEMKQLLHSFSHLDIQIRHLHKENFGLKILQKFIPQSIVDWLGPKFGWYIIGTATK